MHYELLSENAASSAASMISSRVIDLRGWPSFAPGRTEAAPHIAKRVLAIIKAANKG